MKKPPSKIALEAANNIAKGYDQYVSQRRWIGPEVVFGLLKSEITIDQTLLDIGIGTGLCSIKFSDSGVKIYGIDGSTEMIKECAKKNFAMELKIYDLARAVFPFKGRKFDFILAYGVFHILGYFEHIVREASVRLSEKGVFLFSIVENDSLPAGNYVADQIKGIYVNGKNLAGILNYSHDDVYVRNLIEMNGLQLMEKKSILAFKDAEENREVHFSVYVCRKLSAV